MTQPNQIQKSDDFSFAIMIRIEGRNSRAFALRFAGIAAAVVVASIKIALILMGKAP